jgi:hypothetical protein
MDIPCTGEIEYKYFQNTWTTRKNWPNRRIVVPRVASLRGSLRAPKDIPLRRRYGKRVSLGVEGRLRRFRRCESSGEIEKRGIRGGGIVKSLIGIGLMCLLPWLHFWLDAS